MALRLLTILVSLLLAMSLVGCGEDVPPSVRTQAVLIRSAPANRMAFSDATNFDVYTEALIWLSDDSGFGDQATKYLIEVYKECSPSGRVVISRSIKKPDGSVVVDAITTQDEPYFRRLKLSLLQKLYAPQSAAMTQGTYIHRMRRRESLFMKLKPDASAFPNDPWFGVARSLGLYPNTN